MKLHQTLEINGVITSQESSGEIFGLLQSAQWELASQRPDLDPLWLQSHPRFLHYLGCLFHSGQVNIFSLMDQVDMKIQWSVVAKLVAIEAEEVKAPEGPQEPPMNPMRSDYLATWVKLTDVEETFWSGVKLIGKLQIAEDCERWLMIFGMGPSCPPECQVWMENSPHAPGYRYHVPLAEAKENWSTWGGDTIGEFPREYAPSPSEDFEQI